MLRLGPALQHLFLHICICDHYCTIHTPVQGMRPAFHGGGCKLKVSCRDIYTKDLGGKVIRESANCSCYVGLKEGHIPQRSWTRAKGSRQEKYEICWTASLIGCESTFVLPLHIRLLGNVMAGTCLVAGTTSGVRKFEVGIEVGDSFLHSCCYWGPPLGQCRFKSKLTMSFCI